MSGNHITEGERAFRAGEYERAAEAFREAAREDPNDRIALGGLSRALFEARRFEEATSYCRQSLQLVPSDALPHIVLGKIAAAERRFAEAEAELTMTLDLEPDNAEAFLALGAVRFSVKDYRGAITFFEKALQIGPESSNSHTLLGTAHQYAGRHAEAVREHRRAFGMQRTLRNACLLSYAFFLKYRLLTGVLLILATLTSIITTYALPGAVAFAFLFLMGAVSFAYGSRRRALAIWLLDMLLVGFFMLSRAAAG